MCKVAEELEFMMMKRSRSAQKQELEEVRGIKIPVYVQIFEKAALEQKNLDS